MLYFLLALAGAAGGVLGGMGMGGGTLLIPALTLMFGMSQTVSQGINLISFIPMAVVAIVIHAKNKMIKFRGVWKIAVPAAAFSALGSYLVRFIGGDLQIKLFGAFLIVLSVVQFFIVRADSGRNEGVTPEK